MEHQTSDKSYGSMQRAASGIKTGFLLSFVLVIGLGAINFGYSLGAFNAMQKDFLIVFDIKDKEE
jgi:hypothetical protein